MFLGMHIRKMRKRGSSKYYVYTKPSRKAIAAIKDKVKAKTYRSTRHMDLDQVIAQPEPDAWRDGRIIFRHGMSKAMFYAVDYIAWGRIMRWIRAKCAGKDRARRWRKSDVVSVIKGWRFAHNGVVFTGASSVAVTRYRYRGKNIPTPWTPKPAAGTTGG